MTNSILSLLHKAARKPPHVLAHRLVGETRRLIDRHTLTGRQSWPTRRQLLAELKADSIGQLWQRIAARPYVAAKFDSAALQAACSVEEWEAILAAAERAVSHRVELFGSGLIPLGERIRWNRDYKTDHCWPNRFAADIEYANLDQPSDVKFAWELSRLQWLLPAGQAYLLTGDERYAIAVRNILQQWIEANPYAWSVNWSCTMEPALRIVSWTWLFHVFQQSESWQDEGFQKMFLSALYAHGRFTEQYLEYSDVNGNHCTADAAGMLFAGLFFGGAEPHAPRPARRWQRAAWRLLAQELPKQVTVDGVDFEGSVAYHRLCAEMFFLSAWYREQLGLSTPPEYRERVLAMARFTQAYTKPTGSAPLWGDADDARTLPLGRQPVNDHRYLPTMIGAAWNAPELVDRNERVRGECLWMLGVGDRANRVGGEGRGKRGASVQSVGFEESGYYVMRNAVDHVFVDAAEVGTAGRGGHGHNDCLSFEAVLCGVELVSDCGVCIYTGSYAQRNRFRATAAHNTPRIDGEEINGFHGAKALWTMQYDARPEVRRWACSPQADELAAAHAGYQKLGTPVTPVRTFRLEHAAHRLTITDRFESAGEVELLVEIPLHFAPGVALEPIGERQWRLTSGDHSFRLDWGRDRLWQCEQQPCQISPSYGVLVDSHRLVWQYMGSAAAAELMVTLAPW